MVALASRKRLESEGSVGLYIPYSHHVTDDIISTGDGSYLAVWKLDGRSHQSASEEDVFTWLNELNNLLRGIGSDHLSIWSHVVRRRVQEYPESDFDNAFCRQLDDKYRASFNDVNLMVNELYITLVYRPTADKVMSTLARAEKLSLDQKEHRANTCIKALQDINKTFYATVQRYRPERLRIYTDNGYTYSSALEFLALLVNGEHRRMPVCRERFYEYMAFNRPMFSKWGELGEIRSQNGQRRFGMVEIKEYTDSTQPGHLNVLLESEFEFVLTQSFTCLSRHAARGYLERHKQALIDANDAAVGQIRQIDDALDQLISGHFVMGEHHCTLLVWGGSADEVRDNLGKASASLIDVAIMPRTVDLALEAGFWAQLPANWAYRPRPAPITSLNFLSFSSLHNFMQGKPAGNPWGPAVTILKTVSGTPLYFNFHASRLDADETDKKLLGNTCMIGQSGAGKTVLLGFLMAQAQKFKPKVVAFDKDRGMEIAIRAMGGRYSALDLGKPTGFNPLQCDASPENMIFLKRFVTKLVESGGDVVSHSDEKQIDDALYSVMQQMDPQDRCLTMLLQFLPNPHSDDINQRPSVHARLKKWTGQGEYGWLFDNPTDTLDLSACRLFGFDVTQFLDHDDIRTPLVMYLLHRSENMIDGEPFAYVFDEFWKMLQDPVFEDLAKNKSKTIRKENGIFVFATQEPDDALQSKIGKTLVQQCATYIFLPNPKADYDDYVSGFKLTDSEFDLIKSLGEMSRRFLIKQGDNSAIAELNLYGFEDELLVLSGTPDNAELLDGIRQQVGDDPADWMPKFLDAVKH